MDINKVQNKELIDRKFLETVPCNICDSTKNQIVYHSRYGNKTIKEIIGMYRASGDDLLIDRLVRCKKCGLIFINPRIREDLTVKGYMGGSDELFVSQAASREKTFAKSLNLIEKFCPKKGNLLDVGTAGGSFLAVARKRK